MNLLLVTGILLIAGLLFGEIASKCNFPRITGYLLAGVILNPSVLHIIPSGAVGPLNSLVPPAVTRYTGLLLLPKAGLTLGFAFYARDLFPSFGQILFNALVASTI